MQEHVVYILRSLNDGSFYVGYSSFLILRFRQHQDGRSHHTSKKRPWEIAYLEVYPEKRDALIREKQIKSMKSRQYIEQLINQMNVALSSR